jgi:hypothetical protein
MLGKISKKAARDVQKAMEDYHIELDRIAPVRISGSEWVAYVEGITGENEGYRLWVHEVWDDR